MNINPARWPIKTHILTWVPAAAIVLTVALNYDRLAAAQPFAFKGWVLAQFTDRDQAQQQAIDAFEDLQVTVIEGQISDRYGELRMVREETGSSARSYAARIENDIRTLENEHNRLVCLDWLRRNGIIVACPPSPPSVLDQ